MAQETPFIDVHCHRATEDGGDAIRIVNLPRDWSLDGVPEGALLSAGLHPWDINGAMAPDWEDRLRDALSKKGVVAVGECGIDKARSDAAPLEIQENIFDAQCRIASEMGLPVIVHCVRGVPEIVRARRSLKSPTPWIVHGFRGGIELAGELMRHGIRMSFGAKPPDLDLRTMPHDSFMLETDDSGASIREVYEWVAKSRGCGMEELKGLMLRNFKKLFGEEDVPDEWR